MSRPEHAAPPEEFYNAAEAQKYTASSRILQVQEQLANRAVDLLGFPQAQAAPLSTSTDDDDDDDDDQDDSDDEVLGGDGVTASSSSATAGGHQPRYILDVGCGSGLSGEVLSARGHLWAGMDISPSMLDVAVSRGADDVCLTDAGTGPPFRPGVFDGAISISAIQWLCNADKRWHSPPKRLKCFFETLYMVLAKGARAVLQFYPENARQMELITSSATRAGFSGGLVVDYPNSTRAKKYFLVLTAGQNTADLAGLAKTEADLTAGGYYGDGGPQGPAATVTHFDTMRKQREREMRREQRRSNRREPVKSRNWVLQKKAAQRAKGNDVRKDTKYTARKRKDRW